MKKEKKANKNYDYSAGRKKQSPFYNMKMKKKGTLILIFSFIPVFLLLASMISTIFYSEKKHKTEVENIIVNTAEQQINTSIENIVAIAKTLYTNKTLYTFLNKEYSSSVEYYDAFYNLNDNNSLIVAENSNIKKFTIYTDNPTILNGGNISNLKDAKSEDWFVRFNNYGKSLILYCDNRTNTLSIIRKLDYYKLDTGDCYIKIDLNSTPIKSSFADLDFDGSIYVMNEGTLLYSNISNAKSDDVNINTNYICFTKNYYTVELEYYVCRNRLGLQDIISNHVRGFFTFLVSFIICSIILFRMVRYVSKNIIRLDEYYNKNNSFKGIELPKGSDELGHIYKNCISNSEKLEASQADCDKYKQQLENCFKKYNDLLIEAYETDSVITYLKNHGFSEFESEIISHFNDTTLIELKYELQLTSKIKLPENVSCTYPNIDNIPDNYRIPALSIVTALKNLILEVSESNPEDKIDFDISIQSDDRNLTLVITNNGKNISAQTMLKLNAALENRKASSLRTFKPQNKYNPYNRLKCFYGDNMNAIINTDKSGMNIALTFKISALENKEVKKQ